MKEEKFSFVWSSHRTLLWLCERRCSGHNLERLCIQKCSNNLKRGKVKSGLADDDEATNTGCRTVKRYVLKQ